MRCLRKAWSDSFLIISFRVPLADVSFVPSGLDFVSATQGLRPGLHSSALRAAIVLSPVLDLMAAMWTPAPRWWCLRHVLATVGGLTSRHGRLALCHARFYAAEAHLCHLRKKVRRCGCSGRTSALGLPDVPLAPKQFLHSQPEERRALPLPAIPWIAIWCVLLSESEMVMGRKCVRRRFGRKSRTLALRWAVSSRPRGDRCGGQFLGADLAAAAASPSECAERRHFRNRDSTKLDRVGLKSLLPKIDHQCRSKPEHE